jgi:hypothetical protein
MVDAMSWSGLTCIGVFTLGRFELRDVSMKRPDSGGARIVGGDETEMTSAFV